MDNPNQKSCDKLLTPIIKKERPFCESCGAPTQVAHHWIEKSRSSRLRYDIDLNLIALCNSCHVKIHNKFGNSVVGGLDVADVIRKKRGEKWYQDIKVISQEIVKTDARFYTDNFMKLSTRLGDSDIQY